MTKRNGKPKSITTLADVRPQQRNANRHTQRGMGMLSAGMREVGYVAPMTVAADGEAFDGSARLETVADVFGVDVEPIIVHSDGTRPIIHVRDDIPTASDPRAVRAALAANQIAAANLEWDAEVIAAIADDDAALLAGLFERDELAEIMAQTEQPEIPDDPGAQVDRAEELRQKWGVESGDLWALGDHRLVCGDCTDAAVVARVMGGERAGAVVTDPPYGIGFDVDYTRFTGGEHENRNTFAPIESDDKPFDPTHLLGYGAVILWGANCYSHKLPIGSLLVWDKRDNGQDKLLSDGEVAWFNKGHGVYIFNHAWNGFVRESERGATLHPTQKPIALMEWCLSFVRDAGAVIYDPYCGSGPVLLACEKVGRVCRAIEINPGYCAVILDRWAVMTGRTPERIGSA